MLYNLDIKHLLIIFYMQYVYIFSMNSENKKILNKNRLKYKIEMVDYRRYMESLN